MTDGQARTGQQRRTRTALLTATATLLRAGEVPSVAQAAEAADVSRRTAYRYFPTQEQLLTEAALESLRPAIELSFTRIENDPEARLEAAIRSIMEQAAANEQLLRTMIRLTVERGADNSTGISIPIRGNRRVDWIESALAPVRSQLTQSAFSTLISSISLCVGGEALIVLRDIRGLDQHAAADVAAWAAKALLRAALDQAQNVSERRRRRSKIGPV